MAADMGRPGSDPLRPHQDLRIPSRIPSQYFSQVLPSSSSASSSFSTPPVAVQIASLHRAAEVARFEWRAAQRARQATRSSNSTVDTNATTVQQPELSSPSSSSLTSQFRLSSSSSSSSSYLQRHVAPRPPSSSFNTLEAAQARDARMSSRNFASASEAYDSAVRDLNRHTGAGLLDVSDGDGEDGHEEAENSSETSGDSTNTESEVLASTMATTMQRRNVQVGRQQHSSYINWQNASSASMGLSREDNIIAESQVWDRMVNDLAIGAGVSASTSTQQSDDGPYSHQRSVSGGIAASMLALSAAIPRPETHRPSSGSTSTPPRLLPHPIWARRYPGAAGEWLRGELARRASGSFSTQLLNASSSTTNIPRPAAVVPRYRITSTAQWEPLPTTQVHNTSETPFDDLFSDRNRSSTTRRTSNWDWNVLRFPSLDPASRERRTRSDSTNTLAVPADTRSFVPTPPPAEIAAASASAPSSSITTSARDRQTSRPVEAAESASGRATSEIQALPVDGAQSNRGSNFNSSAANLVAQMAQASREMAAARSALQEAAASASASASALASAAVASQVPSTSSNNGNSRATQGGLSYIRRLRQLDGLEPPSEPQISITNHEEEEEENSEESIDTPRLYEVFPWYHPPQVELNNLSLENQPERKDDDDFDPDGSNLGWYQAARDRISAQSAMVSQIYNDDPDGERVEEDGEQTRQTMGVRRRIVAGSGGGGGASQRARNRSALVMADGGGGVGQESTLPHRDDVSRSDAWDAMDSWTLVDQRPMSPVRRSRDEGSENVTTWLREPANPTGRFSTSPLPISTTPTTISPSRPTTTRTIHTYRPVTANEESRSDPRTTRRPRRMPSLVDGEIPPFSEARDVREGTPSPEAIPSVISSGRGVLGRARQLTSIGRRLEEEFRARQGELRQREERLRSEVARRRMELDQVRRRQGRIGRVVDRTRHQTNESFENRVENQVISSPVMDENNEALAETFPLLGEQESSLIRRSALREPRRAANTEHTSDQENSNNTSTSRNAAPTPLQEILTRISLNSSRMHSGSERSLRRTNSWSVTATENLSQGLLLTSLDDHHALR